MGQIKWYHLSLLLVTTEYMRTSTVPTHSPTTALCQ